jgi:hypothetical protein
MVWCNDNHGIDIRARQQLTIIIISCAAGIGSTWTFGGIGILNKTLAILTSYTVNIAYGEYLDFPVADQPP